MTYEEALKRQRAKKPDESDKVVPLRIRPLLPQIELAPCKDDPRLEKLLRYLWQALFDRHKSVQEADRITEYITNIYESKGFLTIDWYYEYIMRDLLPVVKYEWGLLDVAVWGLPVKIEHYYPYPHYLLIDEYSDEDVAQIQEARRTNDEEI